jgi:hypothetical protein
MGLVGAVYQDDAKARALAELAWLVVNKPFHCYQSSLNLN